MDPRLVILFGVLYSAVVLSVCDAGFCENPYKCSKTCYSLSRYTTRCGWRRCTRYRSIAYTCYSTCHNTTCCEGYSGTNCSVADECLLGTDGCDHNCSNNNGTYTCSCRSGFDLDLDEHTCIDIDECLLGANECDHECNNYDGSHNCSCRSGFELDEDGHTCIDVDECMLGIDGCEFECTNTIGSYTCSCQSGFELDLDGHTCIDTDECRADIYPCAQICINEQGTFSCECKDGYYHDIDEDTCTDLDECSVANGGCSHLCSNIPGSFTCSCETGYTLAENRTTCIDTNECADGKSKCDQECENLDGTYNCSCIQGFELLADGHSCANIDDCVGIYCPNNGVCVDGIEMYTCSCTKGFTGDHCETDIDECAFFNGGCQHNCTNSVGSFTCSCMEPAYLHDNGLQCIGVFEKHKLSNEKLPVGDYMFTPATPIANHVTLSSTSKWNRLIVDPAVVYTSGIVHIEVNHTVLPISVSGLELRVADSLEVLSTVPSHAQQDGVDASVTRYFNKSITDVIQDSDIATFIASNSFQRSFFDGIQSSLPGWLRFVNPDYSILPVSDLSSTILLGSSVQENLYCKHAPVSPGRLYNVLTPSVDVAFQVYQDTETIALASDNERICIVTDIGLGGATVMVTFPNRAPFSLPSVSASGAGFKVERINGFAVSLNRGIQVSTDNEVIEVWNGDHPVDYKVFEEADVWMSGEISLTTPKMELSVNADLYLAIPNPLTLFPDTFEDKWEIYFDVHATQGELDSMEFKTNDFIISIGGEAARQTCGSDANPAGLFGNLFLNGKITPFDKIPFIEVVIDGGLQVFVESGDYNGIQFVNEVKLVLTRSLETIQQTVDNFKIKMEICLENWSIGLEDISFVEDLQTKLNEISTSMDTFSSSSVDTVFSVINAIESNISNYTEQLIDQSACKLSEEWASTTNAISADLDLIRSKLATFIQNSANALAASLRNSDGYGFQYKGTIDLKLTKHIHIDGLTLLEYVKSKQGLGSCGRFHKVYELMADEEAERMYLETDRGFPMGKFFKSKNSGFGIAVNKDKDKFILQVATIFRPFNDFEVAVDLFINNEGINAYADVNFFTIFYAQLHIGIQFGDNDWYNLHLHMEGRFGSGENGEVSFSAQLAEKVINLVNDIGENAIERIEKAKKVLTKAQTKITGAQDWLEDKKQVVRKLEDKFDDAIEFLDGKISALERAKGVFEKAAEKLRNAREKVDRLCKIKTCSRICIPGIKCGGWRCKFTRCRYSLTDPVCIARNAICRVIRNAAIALLKLAERLVQAPIIALDIAKSVVSAAQVAVDKAKGLLRLAESALDLAQIGLQLAKAGLEVAITALDLVKNIVKNGIDVFNYILRYGLGSIINIRNCGFIVEMDGPTQPILDVSCDVNPFNTKWITIGMRINFLNPIQSLWQAAKKLVDKLLDTVNIFGRRKTEIGQMYMAHMHPLIRNARSANDIDIAGGLNETISLTESSNFDTAYNTSDEDYTQRVGIYSEKCQRFEAVLSFLRTALNHLSNVSEDFKNTVNEMDDAIQGLSTYSADATSNITLGDAGVNMTVAQEEFNLTDAYVMDAYQTAMQSLQNDSSVSEILNFTSEARAMMEQQKEELKNFDCVMEWTVSMNDTTVSSFDPIDCAGLVDCMQYSMYILNALFHSEDHTSENVDAIEAIDSLETEFLQLINTTDADIYVVNNSSRAMQESIETLASSCIFCDRPPVIEKDLEDMTALYGRSITMTCEASGDRLTYSWMQNGTEIRNETNHQLHLSDLSDDHTAEYTCEVTNMIARAVGHKAALTLILECPTGSREMVGYCVECDQGSYQPLPGQQQCITCPEGSTTTSKGSSTQGDCVGQRTTDPDDITKMIVAVSVSSVVAALIIGVAVFIYCKRVASRQQKKPTRRLTAGKTVVDEDNCIDGVW